MIGRAGWIARMVFRQSIQRRRALALAGLTSLPGLLLALAATTAPSQSIPDIYHGLTVALLLAVGLPVTGLLTAGAAFSEERRAGTIPYLVVKPLPRSLIAIAVTIGAIAATLAIAGVGVAFGWLVAAVVTGQAGIGVPAVAALGVGSIGYAAAFVPLGLLLERVTLTGLVYLFLWEGVLTGVLTAISSSSLWRTSLSAYVALADRLEPDLVDNLGNLGPGVGGAYVKVVVLIVISGAVSTLLLRRRDLV